MTYFKNLITLCIILSAFQTYSQKCLIVGKDTINRIDTKNLKQGKWVFYDSYEKPQVMCSFKNDTIVGNRIFMIDSGKVLVREPLKEGKERFTFIKKGIKIKGWFDKKGNILFDNPADSVKKDSSITYLIGVPAVYQFGRKNLGDEIDESMKPLKKDLKGNKLVITFLINKSGLTDKIDVKLEKQDDKLSQKIKDALKTFDRWQPAFNGWKTEPYKKQVVLNY